jgi:HSP20 family protein
MSNVIVRKQPGDKPPPARTETQVWDPWRTMRSMLAWDPFREMSAFPVDEGALGFSAAFDIKETKDAYEFKADVPGLHEKDLEITLTGNRLRISGKREEEKEDKNDRYYTYERSYGSFTRTFTLPEGADTEKLSANLANGVLSIIVPKKPELQPKKIDVKAPTPATKS